MPAPEKPKWQPATKSQLDMDAKYRTLSPKTRMTKAVAAVLDGRPQAEAARVFGVDRTALNRRLRKQREEQEEREARSAAARAESATAGRVVDPERPLLVQDEVRRVPPITEFERMYFDNLVCPDCDKHHDPPGFHDELLMKIVDPEIKRLIGNVAPYHSKSTTGTVHSTVYEICRNPNSRSGLISKSTTLSRRFLGQIRELLTNPNLYEGASRNLIEDWGPFYAEDGGAWSKDELYVAGRQTSEKDPTVSAYGVGTQIYGTRFDRIICDDIADLENQKNPERVEEMLTQVTQEYASRVGRNGKLIILGTRVRAGDIYSKLLELPGFVQIRYPAILDEETKQTLWPDHFDYDDAVRVRDTMSREQFELVYQNSALPGLGASFTAEMLERAHEMEMHLGQYTQPMALIAGLDPAGANEQSGYTAMVLLGLDLNNGRRQIVDLVRHKQMKAPQMRDQIFDWANRYPLRELRVESNGLQSQLVQYNEEIRAYLTNKGVRVSPHITSAKNKWDEQFGVEAMAPMFYNGMIGIPYGDVTTRRRVSDLEKELLAFPMGETSDLVMALWFAELGAKDLWQRQAINLYDPRATKRLPGRIRRNRRIIDFGAQEVRAPTVEEELGYGAGERKPEVRPLANTNGSVLVY